MARNNDAGGCGWLLVGPLLFVVALSIAVWALLLAGLAVAAPVVVPYLALTDPAQLSHDETAWAISLAVAVVAAVILPSPPIRPVDGLDEPADRRARRVRHLQQSVLLLMTPGLVGLLAKAVEGTRDPFSASVTLAGSALLTAAAVVGGCRLWNRRFPAIGRAATVEEVEAAVRSVHRQVQNVRAQGDSVEKMLRAVERQMANARREVRFTDMCSTHRTSYRCADLAYANYQSARTSVEALSGLATRARATAALRIRPARDPRTGRRASCDRAAMRGGEADLRAAVATLRVDVQQRVGEVTQLNRRTADLRDTIRDCCGHPGRRWYDNLVERRDRARGAEV